MPFPRLIPPDPQLLHQRWQGRRTGIARPAAPKEGRLLRICTTAAPKQEVEEYLIHRRAEGWHIICTIYYYCIMSITTKAHGFLSFDTALIRLLIITSLYMRLQHEDSLQSIAQITTPLELGPIPNSLSTSCAGRSVATVSLTRTPAIHLRIARLVADAELMERFRP